MVGDLRDECRAATRAAPMMTMSVDNLSNPKQAQFNFHKPTGKPSDVRVKITDDEEKQAGAESEREAALDPQDEDWLKKQGGGGDR